MLPKGVAFLLNACNDNLTFPDYLRVGPLRTPTHSLAYRNGYLNLLLEWVRAIESSRGERQLLHVIWRRGR